MKISNVHSLTVFQIINLKILNKFFQNNNMSNKLFVGNIDWGTKEDDLMALFSQHGNVEEVVIIKDKFSGRSKGFGFVTFTNDEDAQSAVSKLNDYEVNGRKLVVNIAKPKNDDRR